VDLKLHLPDSLATSLKEFSGSEHITMDQFISTAIAEKLSALRSYDYLEEKSKKGTASFLRDALSKVSDDEPLDESEL